MPGGVAGVAAYGAGGGAVPAATWLLAPPQAEASRLGDGDDDWRSSRFAFSREALGASSAGELTAMMAELQAELSLTLALALAPTLTLTLTLALVLTVTRTLTLTLTRQSSWRTSWGSTVKGGPPCCCSARGWPST